MNSITARIDRVSTFAPDLRIPTPPAPRSVKIELTSRCNFERFFCASHARPRRKADMSRELRELGVDQLGLFYIGESVLCDWLPGKGVLRKSVPCWPLFTTAHITRDGRLSACCLDHHRRFTMGDLTETSFMQAWHSPAFRALCDAHLSDRLTGAACEHCISY